MDWICPEYGAWDVAAALISSVGYHALFPLAAVCSLIGAVLIVFIKSVK